MEYADEAAAAWEQRLQLAEAELRQREQRALADDPTPEALLGFAAERDKIALDRDTIAGLHDDRAAARDTSALRRDVSGSFRDRHARAREQDLDAGALDRSAAGTDRDRSAGDRADSVDDRRRAREARERAAANRAQAADDRDAAATQTVEQDSHIRHLTLALESRLVIGQAQGLLMARHNVSSDGAFGILVRLSQHNNVKLRDLAAQLVAASEAAVSHRVPDA